MTASALSMFIYETMMAKLLGSYFRRILMTNDVENVVVQVGGLIDLLSNFLSTETYLK